ncbi:RHS repeat domain-containing protein [Phosphitispora fastidiosa]|uniref:RHS repeat domain-containing protein n=1 Tax=Phosphitispora fastidiosa TaxID=2837202 RepID=UPI001E616812|nr:RHS repeat domain-containing protein [Phosphitispora fastidiosa]MBU7006021.1 RHS repeat-associated protein [Phosphitispora fastidiosa]
MKKFCFSLIAFLFTGMMLWCQAAVAETPKVTTVSSLMKVLKEDKQKALYNIELNAPFSKATSGIRETVSTETGELNIRNTIFDIPGRNGMDLSLVLEYRNRDAKAFDEGTSSAGGIKYGETVIAYYDVFDANGYWLKTGALKYPAELTILGETTLDEHKWVFTGYLQFESGTPDLTTSNIVNKPRAKSADSAAKYIFGEGWSLDIPTLEVDGEDDNKTVWVTLPNGQTYKADFTTGTGLADYELSDIVFTKDTTFDNGQDPSAYRLYYADGTSYYFSANGELLVEMDRSHNSIRYYYETINGLRLLTKVVDSVGRVVDIQYNDTGTIFKSGGRSVRLIKTQIPGQTGKFYLSSFVDTQGRQFSYKYTFQEAAFDQIGNKSSENNLYANLIEISYPTGAKTQYVYEKSKKNLNSGFMEYFKVKERRDVDGDRTYNLLRYQYYNEPDGYPTYKADSIDELYKYYSTVTDRKDVTTKYMYNGKHQLYTTELRSDRLLSEVFTKYHDKYNLPVRDTTKTYNAKYDFSEKVDTYEYDHRGNIVAENHPDDPDEINSDEHKIFYSYDFAYNLLKSKKFKQDENTTAEVRYSLSPDKKTVASETFYGNGKLLAQTEYTYDGYGNVTSQKIEKEPGEWVTTRFLFSSKYKGAYLTAVIEEDVKDADGGTRDIKTEYTYDLATGNRLTSVDGKGNASYFRYDALDRLLQETYPDKSSTTYKYDDLNNILEVTNPNGDKLVYDYNGLGDLLRVTAPETDTVLAELQYDDLENPILQKDGNKNTKYLKYDELNRISAVSHADRSGRILADTRVSYDEANYDKFGNPFFKVTVTAKGDRENRVTNYYFDTFEWLAKLGRFNGNKEEFAQYRYDYLGNQTEAIDFAGTKSLFKYDALSQLTKVTDAEDSSTEYRYDRLGNMIAQTDALGQTVSFEYDSLGRQIVVKAPFESGKSAVSRFYYDNNSNLIKTVDPEGFETRQYYTSRNFLSATERVISSTESNITKFEYDRVGNTTKVVKGLNSWQDKESSSYSYEYDSLNRLILSADAADKETRYEYDNNGNLVRLIDRNKVATTYTYDGLNRLVQKQNSKDGKKTAINITIDKLGQTRQMTDASGTTVFDYDNLGRLTSVNYGNGIRQNYAYDRVDRVSALKVLQGSLTQINLNYEYDNVGRLITLNDNGKRFSYKYNDIGQLTEELNGVTGIKSTYQYYPSGNVKNLRHWDGSNIVSSYEYKYDKRGNQIQKDEGNGTTKYYYDPLSRIKTALLPNDKIQNYEYDDLDNIKTITEITGNKIEETSYLYDKNNRLMLQETTKSGETVQHRFTYDAVGNQLTKEDVFKINGNTMATKSFNYYYNGFNQLQRVQTPDSRFVEYTYNGTGLRTKKDFGDTATNYYYNGSNIILETDKNNAVTARNIRGLKLIYRENNPGQVDAQMLFYLHNAHGDVTQLLDEEGQLIKDYRYDPFGQEEVNPLPAFGGKQTTELWRQEVEKIDNPFRYCGEYLDEETGNYYLRARYYDPSVQRFTQEDSYAIAFGAAWQEHFYSYAANNPVRYIDPSGHFFLPKSVSTIASAIIKARINIAKYNNRNKSSKQKKKTVNKNSQVIKGEVTVVHSNSINLYNDRPLINKSDVIKRIQDRINTLINRNESLKRQFSENKQTQLGLTVNIASNSAVIAESKTEIAIKTGLLLFWTQKENQAKVKEIEDDLKNIKEDIERRTNQIIRDYKEIREIGKHQKSITNEWQINFSEIQSLTNDYKKLTGNEYKLPWYVVIWPD